MSQSFIKKPDTGPQSALAGLGVLASERSAQHTPGPVSRAMLDAAMLERIAAAVAAPHDSALCAVAGRIRARADAHEDLVALVREAEPIIASMADWFRNQPLGAPPVGTVELQSRLRAAIAKATGSAS